MASRELIANRKHAPHHLGRVLVLGLGKSGRAAVAYLLPLLDGRVEALAVAAGARSAASEEFAAEARAAGALVAFEDEAVGVLAAEAGGSFDLCIASPGISQFSAFYEAAAAVSAEVISEVEFAWRESAADSRWVAVTGTNGKTTACALAAHVLAGAGLAAAAVGNIGDPCIEAVAAGRTDVYVAEVSSYQLASTARFAPNVAVLLNITPDHLHWHRSFEAYRDAKLKLLANLPGVPGAVAVLDATNDVVRAEVRRLRALDAGERGFSYVPLGTASTTPRTRWPWRQPRSRWACTRATWPRGCARSRRSSTASSRAARWPACAATTTPRRRTSMPRSRPSPHFPRRAPSCCWEATTRAPTLRRSWRPPTPMRARSCASAMRASD